MLKKAVCIISGGMDSALSARIAQNEGYEIIALHFNYGQRTQHKELECFRKIASAVNATETYEIDLPFFEQIGASALTDKNIDVPTGGIEEGVPVTYVPFRNGIFLSIAAAIAEKHAAQALYIGVVEEDSSGYPDCRPEFIEAFEVLANLATREGTTGHHFTIHAPLIHMTKSEIIRIGTSLGVDYSLTHSCYDPTPDGLACGRCDSCHFRKKGFAEAGIDDPTLYAD